MRNALYAASDSWNIVSVTGGADDTNWSTALANWYVNPLSGIADHKLWLATSRSSVGCPDTDSVMNSLKQVDYEITNNLYGVATAAHRASLGVRVLNVGYPQVLDSSDTCNGDSTTAFPRVGTAGVINKLNDIHQGVVGKYIRYVNSASALGDTPISDGYLQLARLYGYPHANATGQGRISTKAQDVVTGSDAQTMAW
jgi:hypothetical protein